MWTVQVVEPEVVVSRRPIFDRSMEVVAYELPFRSQGEEVGGGAALQLLADGLLEVGIERLADHRPAYVSLSRNLLDLGLATLLPARRTVLHLGADVEADESVINGCLELKARGHQLAVGGAGTRSAYDPLLGLAYVLVIELGTLDDDRGERIAARLAGYGVPLLATGVDRREDLERAKALGATMLSGTAFTTPEPLEGRRVPVWRQSRVGLLRAMQDADLDLDEVDRVIRSDAALAYKVLRYANSAAFGLRHEVTSVRQALALLGERQVRKLASLLALGGAAEDKPSELLVSCAVRAAACEALGVEAGVDVTADELFTVGMFSLLDAMLDLPIDQALAEVAVSDRVRAALVEGSGEAAIVLLAVVAHELGSWEQVADAADRLDIDPSQVFRCYLEALEGWMAAA